MDLLGFVAKISPDDIAFGAIITLGLIMILTGRLIPRAIVEERMRDKDAQLAGVAAERDDWKAAFQKKSEEAAELLRMNSALIESGKATNRVIESLRNEVERRGLHFGETPRNED